MSAATTGSQHPSSPAGSSSSSAASKAAPYASTDRSKRPLLCGSDAPERPYPIYLRGKVERGFGRGGKDLGCPTANLPSKIFANAPALSRTGVYFGWARVLPQDPDDPDLNSDEEDTSGEQLEGSGPRGIAGEDVEDEDNEVVLGASPVNPEGNWDLALGGTHTGSSTGDTQLGGTAAYPGRSLKPRQGSRSSIQSSRSANTIAEALHGSSIARQLSSEGGRLGPESAALREGSPRPASVLSDKEARVARAENKAEVEATTASSDSAGHPHERRDQQAQPQDPSQHPSIRTNSSEATRAPIAVPITGAQAGEKHPREISAASTGEGQEASTTSRNSGSRRKKKMRINLAREDSLVFPMVMSVGYNPFYGNISKTAEVHIMHKFQADFYGLEARVVVLGFERPELNYVSREALIEDIETDKKVALASLARPLYQDYREDPFLLSSFSE